jgi:hypothetical protein
VKEIPLKCEVVKEIPLKLKVEIVEIHLKKKVMWEWENDRN